MAKMGVFVIGRMKAGHLQIAHRAGVPGRSWWVLAVRKLRPRPKIEAHWEAARW